MLVADTTEELTIVSQSPPPGARAAMALMATALLIACTGSIPRPSPVAPTATGGGANGPTTTAPAEATDAPPTGLPVPAGSAAGSPVAPASPVPLPSGDGAEGAPIGAGAYFSTGTGLRISFTTTGDWDIAADMPGVGFDLVRLGDAPAGITVMRFGGEVFASACDPDEGTEELPATAAGLIGFLEERRGVNPAGPALPVTVAGYEGLQLDVSTRLPPACRAKPPPWIFLWTLPTVGDFHFADGEQARVVAIDVGDAVIAIVVEAYPGADWEAFLAEAMALVGSMAIEAP